MFDVHLQRWNLVPDGEPIVTPTSRLLPVRTGDRLAILKIAVVQEEKVGARLMRWWDGQGAALVLACDDDALLLERAQEEPSLTQLACNGCDDKASLIICNTVAALHAPRPTSPPSLVGLDHWFEALQPAADSYGGILRVSATLASKLLAAPRDIGPLHGDIHHGNILNFGVRGWLAIDPKGLLGERAFDYANMFSSPNITVAKSTGRLARQLALVASTSGLEAQRLLAWVVAWSGLSAVFLLYDGLSPENAFGTAELAAAELVR